MAVRLKWYEVSGIDRHKLDRILAGLIKDEYSEQKRWGFSNVALHGDYIEGQYVERNETLVKIQDPFGKPVEFSRIDFETFTFLIGTKFPNLEFRDAPRGLGTFCNQIAKYLDFTVGIQPIGLNLAGWLKAFGDEVDSMEVLSAIAGDISLSNSVEAKIAINGVTEIRPFIKKLTGTYRYILTKATVVGTFRSQTFRCDMFSDGRATLAAGVDSEIASVLKKSLIKVVATA